MGRALLIGLLLALSGCAVDVVEPGEGKTYPQGVTELPDGCTWNVATHGERCTEGTIAFCDSGDLWPKECSPAEYCDADGGACHPDYSPGQGPDVLCCP